MKVLLCWEDEHFSPLNTIFRRIRSFFYPDSCMLIWDDSARGNGNYRNYLKESWSIASAKGLPKSGGKIDYLICIADADKATDCCRSISTPPNTPQELDGWIESANKLWTEELRHNVPLSCDPTKVFGVFLRWNKESVAIACYDLPMFLDRLSPGFVGASLNTFFDNCVPSPSTIHDSEFVHFYRKSTRCLESLMTALGHENPNKNHISVADALRTFPHNPHPKLVARIPDFLYLAKLIEELIA